MTRRFLIASALLLPAIVAAAPDFSGSWKIDAAKSNFGALGAPEKFERTIAHSEPNIEYTTTYSFQGREVVSVLKYTTDGTEATNVVSDVETKGSAKWDGETLVIESTRPSSNGDIRMVERWTSVEGGAGIQVEAKMIAGPQEMVFTIRLNKQ
jgi:hypothetical protein